MATDFHAQTRAATISPGKFAPLSALTRVLAEHYVTKRPIAPGEVVLVDMAAVSRHVAGRGLYQRMRVAAQQIARSRGFRRVVGELSSPATQHVILDRMGHARIAEVIFETFEVDGHYPFRAIRNPQGIVLAEGQL